VVYGQRQIKKRRHRHELQQHLLSHAYSEIEELKRAWNISPNEIQLECRVDTDSPGAFGEVWRGTWDGMTVSADLSTMPIFAQSPDVASCLV
jgi:hypothetical protein